MGFKFFVDRQMATGRVRLAIASGDHNGRAMVQPLVLKTFPPHALIPEGEAYAIIDDGFAGDMVFDFLQAAADAAWAEGIRPSQSKDMTNEVAAVRYHLEDMRRLALGTAK